MPENHVSSEEFVRTTSMTLPPINIIHQKTSFIFGSECFSIFINLRAFVEIVNVFCNLSNIMRTISDILHSAHHTSPPHHHLTRAMYLYFMCIFTRFENSSSHHHQHKIPQTPFPINISNNNISRDPDRFDNF